VESANRVAKKSEALTQRRAH